MENKSSALRRVLEIGAFVKEGGGFPGGPSRVENLASSTFD